MPMKMLLIAVLLLPAAGAQEAAPPSRVEFNRDIRPILADTCIKCHGPDPKHREAGLRLDTPEGAYGEFEPGKRALVAGSLEKSHLWKRVSSKDREEVMPPPKSGKRLTDAQAGLIRRWIEQGAEFQGHWAFVPPVKRPVPPEGRGLVDAYIGARLAREGLRFSPEADRRTLARRATLDLTGLPPAVEEVESFAADASPDAYEKLLDRLLASPRYGEHMARGWLDLARYGDTHGLHLDNYREIFPYRDWVIRAFNGNLPFDRFVVEQLAGDLLPDAPLDAQVASGFNRCHVTTSEGGSIDEEVHCRNVFDRVETFGQVFFALTVTCARCHDHKYDPLTQKEYYGLFAFFNSLDGPDMDGNRKDTPPTVKVPDAVQAAELASIRAALAPVEAKLDGPDEEADRKQAAWEAALSERLKSQWTPAEAEAKGPAEAALVLGAGDPVHALRIEAVPAGEGKDKLDFAFKALELKAGGKAVTFRAFGAAAGQGPIPALSDGKGDTTWNGDARKKPAILVIPSAPFGPGPLALKFLPKDPSKVPAVHLKVSTTVRPDLLSGAMPVVKGAWHLLGRFEAPDGNSAFQTGYGPEKGVDLAGEVRGLKWVRKDDFQDGKDMKYPEGVGASFLTRTLEAPSPRKLTFSVFSDDAIQVWLNGSLVLARNVKRTYRKYDANKLSVDLRAGVNQLLIKVSNYGTSRDYKVHWEVVEEESNDLLLEAAAALAVEPDKRNDAQKADLRRRYRREHWPGFAPLAGQRAELKGRETALLDAVPTTLVFKEKAQPRDAFILKRGEYDRKGDKVGRHTPAFLPAFPKDAPPNRLGLARWILDPAHPLTARVAVNRFWQQLFGVGLVKTSEDFGLTGEPPVHPELLDALAIGFIEDGWDVKRFLKNLMMSATYRQSSKVTPELARRDPENRLLARGPRFRMDAETVRDQFLFLSGLLVEKVGGPSVKPPQPEGLWEAVGYTGSNTYKFKRDAEPEKVFRRSLYIFWKRTSAPPMMTIFDAPSRESCIARRERTNTPLQALMMMNEPQAFEAARHLAQKAIREGGRSPEERAAWMLRRCTQRVPGAADVAELAALVAGQRALFDRDPAAARQAVAAGDLAPDGAVDPGELAAWTMAASAVLNLDEVLNKR
jgi:hypothetical protein